MRYVVNPKIENKTQMFYNKSNQLYYYALKLPDGKYDFYGLGASVIKLDSEVVFELHLLKYGESMQTLDGTPCCIKEFSLEEQLQEAVDNEDYELAIKLRDRINKLKEIDQMTEMPKRKRKKSS